MIDPKRYWATNNYKDMKNTVTECNQNIRQYDAELDMVIDSTWMIQ